MTFSRAREITGRHGCCPERRSLLLLPEIVKPVAEWSTALIELLGVGLIALLAIWALARGLAQLARPGDHSEVYRETRQRLARGILLGLELLVAGDIIHTVAVELTFTSVGVLAIVVLIRTFLSFTLEVEMSGRWPWQSDRPQGCSPP